MKLISEGSNTIDLTSPVAIPLNGVVPNHINNLGTGQEILVLAKFNGLTVGAELSYQIKVGALAGTAKPLPEFNSADGSIIVEVANNTKWQSIKIGLGPVASEWDTLKIEFLSSNGADSSVLVDTMVFDMNTTDAAGHVNLGRILDEAVTLTEGKIDSNAILVGGNTPLTREEVMNSRGGW